MKNVFQVTRRNLKYTIDSYLFFAATLNNPECRTLVTTHHFKNNKEINAYEIELSWAFFTRMESVLEFLITQIYNKNPNQKKCIEDLFGVEGMKNFDEIEIEGLKIYRVIRNTLHHEDGNPNLINNNKGLKVEDGNEIQLKKDHLINFYNLFMKVVDELEKREISNKSINL